MSEIRDRYDVVIVGAGLAGLTLCRHLLLYTDKTVLLLDKWTNPPRHGGQKYGESLVQCAGYYLSKVLDLQEHLLNHHYLKYNLRFHWPTPGLENRAIEDYSVSYARSLSNIATFQLDRNVLEEHLLEVNRQNPRCCFLGGARNAAVDLGDNGDSHTVRFEGGEVSARWVVDATGRSKMLARQLGLSEPNPIRHGSTFFWVDGLIDIEKLTARSHKEAIFDRKRRMTGHFPACLATNHFCAEGQWLWVIPLHHKTSIGLVYDPRVVNPDTVSNTRKLIDYICRAWPVFAADLPHRKVLDEGRFPDFSYDCRQTISNRRWALVGEAGRFSDPLYSPGSDLIAIYNTLVVDAIETEDQAALDKKCLLAEQIQRVMYESYVPSYSVSYDCLGDQEAFTMKYSWELSVYFCFYVLPIVNNLFANQEFMPAFLRRYGILGPVNANIQRLLSAYFQWKKAQPVPTYPEPNLLEFYDMHPLRDAEKLFYEVGLEPRAAVDVVDRHVDRLQDFARYIIAHIHSAVLGNPAVMKNASFVKSLRLRHTVFDPDRMCEAYEKHAGCTEIFEWNLNPHVLERFVNQPKTEEVGA
ncbi:MAG: tryptophan 7-halogenase [Acidobacteria bacterium]|nr:tryptophan 7-halogenase [Acidobacteriota bacterium]